MGHGSVEISPRKTHKQRKNNSKKKLQEDDELIDDIANYLLDKFGVK